MSAAELVERIPYARLIGMHAERDDEGLDLERYQTVYAQRPGGGCGTHSRAPF